jgi:hypothetical protein
MMSIMATETPASVNATDPASITLPPTRAVDLSDLVEQLLEESEDA